MPAMNLGRVGVWSLAIVNAPPAEAREAAAEIDALGYGALWYPEGPEAFTHGALLLSWTERLLVASGIANIYARDAHASANGAATLGQAYPNRFLLGLGVSHRPLVERRGHQYGPPVSTMGAYLDAMDESGQGSPPRVLAALGPRMLRLAAERSDGALSYFVPREHTAFARETMGKVPLLCVEQLVLLETNPGEARRMGREFAAPYLRLENYRNNLRRLGFSDVDFDAGGSDRLIDAVTAWGDVDAITSRIQAHLDAGADHVCIQTFTHDQIGVAQLRELAPALLAL